MSKSSGSDGFKRNMMVRFSGVFTVVLILMTAVGSYLGSKVDLKLSLTDLLPDNHPAVVKFNRLTEVVGGVGYFTIVLRAENGTSHLNAAPQITAELAKSPLVRSAFYHREQRYFVDRLLYYLSLDQLKELQSNITAQIRRTRSKIIDLGLWDTPKEDAEVKPVFNDDLKKHARKSAGVSPFLISADQKHLLIMVKPTFDSTDLKKTEELVAVSDEMLKKLLPADVTYEYAERYYNKIVETKLITTDIFVLGTIAIVSIALILLLYLKSLRLLAVIFIPVFMGMGITMGLTYLVIGHINIITGFLFGIVSGLGVDYGIHLVLRLRLEHREPSSSDPDPVWRTLNSSGHSVLVGAFAAALAFFLLCFSSFKAFSEFGFICGVGITSVVLCLLLSFSTLVRFLKVDKPQAIKKGRWEGKFKFPVLSLPKGYRVGLAVTIVLIGLSLFSRFEYDFSKMLQHSKKMEEMFKLVDAIYDRSNTPSAIATQSKDDALKIETLMKDKYIPTLVSEMISGASIIPDDQEKKQVILGEIHKEIASIKDKWIQEGLEINAATVRTWVAAKPFTFSEIPQSVQDALRGTQQSGYLLYLYPAIKLDNAPAVKKYATMVRDVEAQFPEALTGSDAVIFSDILDLINKDGLLILFTIFAAVGVFIWASERSIAKTMVSYLPLLISLPVGMGLMVLFGVKFNIFNISIIPTFVAMGIDVPIHIGHRTEETGSGYKAVRDLAVSINLALMTAAVGFGVLIFARAGVLKSLGWVALLGTVGIWWVGLLMLPAYLEKRGRKGKGINRTAVSTEQIGAV